MESGRKRLRMTGGMYDLPSRVVRRVICRVRIVAGRVVRGSDFETSSRMILDACQVSDTLGR